MCKPIGGNVQQKTRTILAVDDDPDVLKAVGAYLNTREYNVVTAQRWTEAITQLTDESPDAVLLDLHMPTVQGEALLEFIRENYAKLPVIIISSGATPTEMARLGELGANGFIRKPFDTDDLLVILEQVLLDLEAEAITQPVPAPSKIAPSPEAYEIPEDELEEDDEDALEEDDEDQPISPEAASSRSQLPPNISPGSGIQNLTRMQPQQKQEVRRRRSKKKRTGGRKVTRLRKIRNLVLIVLFFVAMSYGIYHFRTGLDTNFIGGISFGAQKAE